MIELVGFAAFVLNVLGNVFLARKRLSGWLIRIVSIVLWGFWVDGEFVPFKKYVNDPNVKVACE
jgi:hypothetical protein